MNTKPFANSTTARQFKILGICDNINACDCCGKTDLQKTVAIENCETGVIGYFGTTCAMQPSKCFGFEKREINSALSHFKARQQSYYAKVSRIYKERGGKRIQVEYAKNLYGWPLYESRYEDLALRDAIIAELGPIATI
jgi:hypothetical protein